MSSPVGGSALSSALLVTSTSFHPSTDWVNELETLRASPIFDAIYKNGDRRWFPDAKLPLSELIVFVNTLLENPEVRDALLVTEAFRSREDVDENIAEDDDPRYPGESHEIIQNFQTWYTLKHCKRQNSTAFLLFGRELANRLATGRISQITKEGMADLEYKSLVASLVDLEK